MKQPIASERMINNYIEVSDAISTTLVRYYLVDSGVQFAILVNDDKHPTGLVSTNGRELLVTAHASETLYRILMDDNVWAQLEAGILVAIVIVDDQKLPCGTLAADTLREYQQKEFSPSSTFLSGKEASDQTESTPASPIEMVIVCALCGTPNVLTNEFRAGVSSCSNVSEGQHLLEQTSERVLFSAYVPPRVPATHWSTFNVYVHTDSMTESVEAINRKSEYAFIGMGSPKLYRSNQLIRPGTRLTLVPESERLVIEPLEITKIWNGKWVAFSFDFQPTPDLVRTSISFRISIQVRHIEISHIDCTMQITPDMDFRESIPPVVRTADVYQKIFVSYSRKDRDIVDQYFKWQGVLGNDVWIDTNAIRPGEDWREVIKKAIREADVFQLFWSKHSASSKEVRKEWEYALETHCADGNCHGFIRPVYWEDEMPECPPELSRLNFKHVQL